jgi:hypothetical protein
MRLPKACTTEELCVVDDAVGNWLVVWSVVGVVVAVVVVLAACVVAVEVDDPPPLPPRPPPPVLPDPAAAADPAVTAKNRMEVAASRRKPVTAFEYDKPTLSLSWRLRG